MRTCIYIIFILLAASSTKIAAQVSWQQANGPYGGNITAIATHPTTNTLYALSQNAFYLSTDKGSTWVKKSSGLENYSAPYMPWIYPIVVNSSSNTLFLVSTDRTLYYSTDGGDTWSLKNTLTDVIYMTVNTVSGKLFAATSSAVYSSINNGDTWINLNVPTSGNSPGMIYSKSADTIFVTSWLGLHRSYNGGTTWSLKYASPGVTTITSNSNGELFIS